MPLTHALPNFALSEFTRPELIDEDAANFLQTVRSLYGKPLIVTSDARTPEENVRVGGSQHSWHMKGRAFDLRWPPTREDAWRLVDAVFLAVEQKLVTVELELVYGGRDKHVHLAVRDDGRPSKLIVAAD